MSKLNDLPLTEIENQCRAGVPLAEVARRFNVSRGTVRYVVDGQYRSRVNRATTERRRQLKAKAVDYSGGRCLRCGYDGCFAALAFHHLDPAEKDFAICASNWRWSELVAEIDKTLMLCSRCHVEVHYGVWVVDPKILAEQKRRRGQYEDRPLDFYAFCFIQLKKPPQEYVCKCGRAVTHPGVCRDCYDADRRETIPARHVLEELVWQLPMTRIAEHFKVSDTAVKKWCRSYRIETPGRGYWAKTRADLLFANVE